jgi:spartin
MVSTNTQGFLLLSIPSCTLTGPSVSQSGQLSLECYTLPVPAEGGQPADRDVWLVLRVGSFEMPISPTSPIRKSREKNTYTFTQGDGSTDAGAHVLRLPPPSTVNDQEDLETLEVLFEQYGIVLSETPSGDEKGKATLGSYGSSEHGKLLLVDEEDGHVIGHLDQEFTIKEDTTVNAKGREKDPVIVDLPLEGDPNAEIHVHSVKEDDPILRAAGFLRCVGSRIL